MHSILLMTAVLVGLPILLHLIMKQEPKRLIFPAIRFLQQKQKTNQRKLRLRHWLLLALRMLLIALFGLALYQPMLTGDLGGINLGGEQPVAAVFIIDTSPSMGYVANDRTRLAEATRRALELLEELPNTSKVAILDPAEPIGAWELSLAEARKKLELMKEPRPLAVPVTSAIATAYQLFRTVDQESEATDPLPRLLAIFSDRTTASWDASRNNDLTKLREGVPPPTVTHLFVDVGIDTPTNVAITAVDLSPQILPQGKPIVLNATLSATGADVDAVVRCKLVNTEVPEQKKVVKLASGASAGTNFTFDSTTLKPGVYHAEVSLETPDKLEADNVRSFTFRVSDRRRILTLTDDGADADVWAAAHDAVEEFDCEVRTLVQELPKFADYESVTLLNVADPSKVLPALQTYVEGGGQLVVLLGPACKREAYGSLFLPASPTAILDTATNRLVTDPRYRGVTWVIDEEAMRHPLLAPFRDWKLRGNIDFILAPPRATTYWDLKPANDATIVARFDDEDELAKRRAAVVERVVGKNNGRVLMLATSWHRSSAARPKWNDYFESSWAVTFPNRVMRYLCGDPAQANFNFVAGQPVVVALPKGITKGAKLRLEGRGVSGRDAEVPLNEGQTEFRWTPQGIGPFTASLGDSWKAGFSVNLAAEEAVLTKQADATIEGLLGPNTVVPLGKDVKLKELLTTRFTQPMELFPWLLILVLLALSVESLFANRFYRR